MGRTGAIRQVHLVAVGGVGMAALAGLLQSRGFAVTGSDENVYPPMSGVLDRLRIRVFSGYKAENLAGQPDLVVIGNKVSRDNPEVRAVLDSGIPYTSFPEALARFFLAGHQSLVVAGTHGKTTSTAMLAWVLESAGCDPGFMVGGQVVNFGGNFKVGSGEYFVVEGDEYDSAFFDKRPKFVHYQPAAAILTAVEFDHADIYENLDAVRAAFAEFLLLVPTAAPLVVASDFPEAVRVAGATGREFSTFGCGAQARWRIDDLHDDGEMTRFVVRYEGGRDAELRLRQPGRINARNALGVYVLCRRLGLKPGVVREALAEFRGVARRQEVVGTFRGVTVVDDFAHHPTAVAGVIEAVRGRYPRGRLWALFEPRSNSSRRRVFQTDYAEALAAADHAVIGPVLRKRSDQVAEQDLFSPEQLVADLRARGQVAEAPSSVREIVALVARSARAGDVVLIMSNGDFGGLRDDLVSALRVRNGG